jgi:UBA-like domain
MAQQADPMPQDVAQFKDFTGCADDRLIIAYLRRADFNVPAAVENFFERNGAELVSL